MHATDGILLKLMREFQLLKEKHTKNIKSQMTSKEIRKAITNQSRLFKRLRRLWQIMWLCCTSTKTAKNLLQ